MLARWLFPPLVLALALPASLCGNRKQYTLRFAAQVGSEPLRCDASYPGIGLSGTELQLLDFKAYVRDIALVRANGEKYGLTLLEDGPWQHEGIALLDFEDGTGTCNTASPETRTEVVGRAAGHDDYVGVQLTLGVPEELNHLHLDRAEPPLDQPGMWWSWKAGYRFLRLDVRTRSNAAWSFHLGADGCQGTPAEGFQCAATHEATVLVSDFDPETGRIVFDLAALFAQTDLDAPAGHVTEPAVGCMSEVTDPDCPPLLRHVGIDVGVGPSSDAVPFIRGEP